MNGLGLMDIDTNDLQRFAEMGDQVIFSKITTHQVKQCVWDYLGHRTPVGSANDECFVIHTLPEA